MSAGPFQWYPQALLEMGSGTLNLSSATLVMILATNSYVPAPATDATYANISSYEVATGSGYTVGGVTLTSVSWSQASAAFTASQSGTTLTVSAISSGTLQPGMAIYNSGGDSGESNNSYIVSQLTGTTGSTGTYQLNNSQTVSSEAMAGAALNLTFASPSWASFSATCRWAAVLTRAGGSLASTDKLVGFCDVGGGSSLTGGGGTFTITIPSPAAFILAP